jgi:hypothetical protein
MEMQPLIPRCNRLCKTDHKENDPEKSRFKVAIHAEQQPVPAYIGEYDPFEKACSVIVYSRVSNFLAAQLLSKFLELQDVN